MNTDSRSVFPFRLVPERETFSNDETALYKEFSRIRHIYNSAMQVASAQLDILDQEFNANYDHQPIHHLECRLKSLESIIKKL